jgi:hypothetical protein
MKLEYHHQGTYGEIFLYMIFRISFSYSYHIEKSAVEVYFSQSILP